VAAFCFTLLELVLCDLKSSRKTANIRHVATATKFWPK